MAVMNQAAAISKRLDVPRPGGYLISPELSTVTIRTRHLFGLGPVRATIGLRDGRIIVAEPPEASTVQARFAVSTFRSGNETRDAAVLSPRLLDAEASPTISFISTDLVNEQGNWSLRGELEVRGAVQQAEVRIRSLTVDDAGATLRADAEVSVDRYAFGITAYRGLAGRRLTVALSITAKRETA
jgi:polyisoprenoid-binding protein YceI